MSKRDCLARSVMGRVAWPFGGRILRPRWCPAMIRTIVFWALDYGISIWYTMYSGIQVGNRDSGVAHG